MSGTSCVVSWSQESFLVYMFKVLKFVRHMKSRVRNLQKSIHVPIFGNCQQSLENINVWKHPCTSYLWKSIKVSHSVLIYLIIDIYDLTPGWKADFISLHRPIDTLTIEWASYFLGRKTRGGSGVGGGGVGASEFRLQVFHSKLKTWL